MVAMLDHCQRAYEIMAQDSDESGQWTGFVSSITAQLHLGPAMGSKVISNLKNMACIEELRRGQSHLPGVFKLIEFPTGEHWKHSQSIGDPKVQSLTYKPKRVTNYVQMANDLNTMGNALAQVIDKVNELITRVDAVEEENKLIKALIKERNG